MRITDTPSGLAQVEIASRQLESHLSCGLTEHPCSTADEAIAGARRVAKVAQCQPEDLKSAVPGLDNQTSHDPSPAWLKPNSHRGPLIDPSLWQSGLR